MRTSSNGGVPGASGRRARVRRGYVPAAHRLVVAVEADALTVDQNTADGRGAGSHGSFMEWRRVGRRGAEAAGTEKHTRPFLNSASNADSIMSE